MRSETAEAAVHEHLAALNSHETRAVSATITYPFIQILPDGRSFVYADEAGYPPSTRGPQMTLSRCAEISRSIDGGLVIFEIDVDQEHDGGGHRGPRRALYAALKTEDGWKIAWRQFLGYL